MRTNVKSIRALFLEFIPDLPLKTYFRDTFFRLEKPWFPPKFRAK